ncbi:DNA recombination protein RmuC [Chelatococcus sp. SYSU_G07232]|uniref:DNA recombination protein RmuC homolog n=1 Tax=Chelatococcus albus TaxID=3047466 RepID=A0ABT7AE88_9HYPH|nr:DNA recombination protein RmuC [Chelatococcus sp. SYSU_G07232]MDJ1157677.1 DNA recombination protein RmuC [Chelatococcus sp. SYSU_G07232]
MNDTLLVIAGRAVTLAEATLGLGLAAVALLAALAVMLARGWHERVLEAAAAAERAREMDDKMAELARLQAEMTGRMQTVAEIFGTRQGDLARFITERLDGLQHRVGQGLEATSRQTVENLARLNERLAVIDAAQKNLTDLTGEVVGLKDILANKQARGAYGQGRMEAIVRDGLPAGAYEFQATLKNGRRPDCLVRLPGDHPLVIDAKFPLEGFIAFREAPSEETRRQAAQRVKADVTAHVRDIAEKYLLPGETQDMALLFVPSEAIYADLQEHFEDVVQRAHRARVVIVSPSLLALAIQVMQALVRDARMREEAQKIQVEVRRLLDDVGRLGDRVAKLDAHFRQAQDDVGQIKISADKIVKRGERIEALEFEDRGDAARPAAVGQALRAAE